MTKIDLHMHSIYSDDGQYTVKELFDIAKKQQLTHMAIADHNSVKAIYEAHTLEKDYDIEYIDAVELDCTYKGVNLHLLGYSFDYTLPIFEAIEKDIYNQMLKNRDTLIQKIQELGIIIDMEKLNQLCPDGIVVGEDIAEVVIPDTRNHNHPLIQPYLENGTRSDNPFVNFYWDICSQGKPAYVKMEFMSLQDAMQIIHSAGGICVVAHPGNNFKGKDDILKEILAMDVQGLEVYSSYHSQEQIAYYKQLASDYSKICTVGSDFHGKTKPNIQMGSTSPIDADDVLNSFKSILK